MKTSIVWILRFLIVVFVLLPLLIPTVEREKAADNKDPVTIFVSQEHSNSPQFERRLRRNVESQFENQATLEWRWFGNARNHPAQDFEELLALVNEEKGTVVVVSHPRLWGPAARKFNAALKATRAFQEKRLIILPWDVISKMENDKNNPGKFLVLSELFLPKMSFIGEESIATVEVSGKADPNEEISGEIILRTSESVLTSKPINLKADDKGMVNQIVDLPVTFIKATTQVVTATITAPHVVAPLDNASTTVTIAHGKTTILHVAVGPDWSLRNFRQRLKFWPNLDLLSYYILREAADDTSIPASELSLIEFPVEKLFGSELPNFHGIVVQNFPFDNYLNTRDAENLVNYVKNGGRLALQYGPLSFQSRDANIRSLFPCKNNPELDTSKIYAWEEAEKAFSGNQDLSSAVKHISSNATAIGCNPKDEAIILARTKEGKHPVLLAMPLERGLSISLLAGDWHTFFAKQEIQSEAEKASRILSSSAVESLFHWVVEFLQRRQDGGMRPPDFLGPRIYANDLLLPLKTRGLMQLDAPVGLYSGTEKIADGSLFALEHLNMEVAQLSKPPRISDVQGTDISGNSVHSTPVPLHLQFESAAYAVFKGRPTTWPVFSGSTREREHLPNPAVFAGVTALGQHKNVNASAASFHTAERVPLLTAWPFLLALALALLALEQFLTHILWKNEFEQAEIITPVENPTASLQ
jgi:hypothetical protein